VELSNVHSDGVPVVAEWTPRHRPRRCAEYSEHPARRAGAVRPGV